ncbi:GspH/FimT family pseudopilin [Luteibacter sahnii]|uniref:GspH/FimT family pseudopilin n=1 Tax=Luteibacter sahnii TaxID=3021977 RepID=UPI002A6A3CEB|nr:GspH/FimT family pseudopilin [Luteibacter sp. PPL193]MDY1547244.1 GspH/FimT family pseudopilin [Luteibacter sp. PPL193]
MKPRSSGYGFSLIELVVTLLVFAVLLAIAVPTFSDFMKRNAVAAQTNELLGALRLARSTAVTRGVYVSVCPSSNVASATPTCTSGGNVYDTGWLVYVNSGPKTAYAAGNEVLQVTQGMSNASIQGNASLITFDARGSSVLGGAQFWVCAKSSSDTVGQSGVRFAGRTVILQSGGRAASAALATSSNASTAQGYCKSS